MSSNFVYLVVLTTLLALASRSSSRTVEPVELLNSIQTPIVMAHNFPAVIKSMRDNSNDSGDRLCQIEYQVTRKRTGKCVSIAHGLTGCVSEEYMNPFHPDCF